MKIRSFLPILALFTTSISHAQEGLKMNSPLPFEEKARLRTLQSQNKNWDVKIVYPQFFGRSRLLNFANTRLKSEASQGFTEYLKQTRKDLAETDFKPLAPYNYEQLPQLHFYRPARLVSTAIDFYQYNGGAHGLGGTLARNFGMEKGKPKDLVLGDFFTSKNYSKRVQNLIFAKLRANKAQEPTWLLDGSVKFLNAAQLNNFTVSPKGLTWFFNPYEIGPYALGQYVVTLSPRELGADFRVGWLK